MVKIRLQQRILMLIILLTANFAVWAGSSGDLESKIAALRGKDDFKSQSQLAILYLEKFHIDKNDDEWKHAMRLALECRRLSPKSALPHIIMARAFMAKDQKRLAIERTIRAFQLEPKNHLVKKQMREFNISDKEAEFLDGYPNYDAFCPALQDNRTFFEDVALLAGKYTEEITAFGIIALILLAMLGLVLLYLFWTVIRLFFKLLWKLFKAIFGRGKAGKVQQ